MTPADHPTVSEGAKDSSALPLPPYSYFIGRLEIAPRPPMMVAGVLLLTSVLEALTTSLRLGFPEIFPGYNLTTLHVYVIICALLTPLRVSWIPALVMGL